MKITKLLLSESSFGEVVFETRPPVTPEIIAAHNANLNLGFTLGERNGKLVVSRAELRALRFSNVGNDLANMLAASLTDIEVRLRAKPTNVPAETDRWMERVAHWFGVPAE